MFADPTCISAASITGGPQDAKCDVQLQWNVSVLHEHKCYSVGLLMCWLTPLLQALANQVCEKVESKQRTTYNEVADELVSEFGNVEGTGQYQML